MAKKKVKFPGPDYKKVVEPKSDFEILKAFERIEKPSAKRRASSAGKEK